MANWLNFEKLKEWPEALFPEFQYDTVTDDDIRMALANEAWLSPVDAGKDWEDDAFLDGLNLSFQTGHAYRIAAIVRELQTGVGLRNCIQLDTFALGKCRSGVTDGHHRIRALQFLGCPVGPFALSGYLDLLEHLVQFAGAEPPVTGRELFSADVLAPTAYDVLA